MPRERFSSDHAFLARQELLTFEEIAHVVRLLSGRLRKVRLTGGEPLLRKDLPTLVRLLREAGARELALTTNGVLLPQLAAPLAAAGLDRVTVSLDALDDAVFRRVTDADYDVADVLRGIDSAAAAGLKLKLNSVIRRGLNEAELLPLARHFHGTGHELRFIEYMDVGSTNGWSERDVVTAEQMVQLIDRELPLEPFPREHGSDVALRYRYRDGGGTIGVIASVTRPFCGDCSRLRLSAAGQLYTCLFATRGTELRAPLRAGASDAELVQLVERVWSARSDRYSEQRAQLIERPRRKLEMSYLGG